MLLSTVTKEKNETQFEELDTLLESIASFCETERSFFLRYNPSYETLEIEGEWCQNKSLAQKSFVSDTPIQLLPFWQTLFNNNIISIINDIKELAPELKTEYCTIGHHKAKAFILSPIVEHNQLIGILGIEKLEKAFTWHKKDIDFVKIISRLLLSSQNTHQYIAPPEKEEKVMKGLSHDLTNILSPIAGFTELLIKDRIPKENQKEIFQKVHSAASSAIMIIQQHYGSDNYAGRNFDTFDINSELRKMKPLLEMISGPSIDISFDLNGHITTVNGSVAQFQRVLINIASNAKEVLTDNGQIHISSSHLVLDETSTHVKEGKLKAGDYIKILIKDNGPGIDKSLEKSIFKLGVSGNSGKNKGMGLWIAKSIVHQMNGFISALNGRQGGAQFEILLPLNIYENFGTKSSNTVPVRSVNKKNIMLQNYLRKKEENALCIN